MSGPRKQRMGESVSTVTVICFDLNYFSSKAAYLIFIAIYLKFQCKALGKMKQRRSSSAVSLGAISMMKSKRKDGKRQSVLPDLDDEEEEYSPSGNAFLIRGLGEDKTKLLVFILLSLEIVHSHYHQLSS